MQSEGSQPPEATTPDAPGQEDPDVGGRTETPNSREQSPEQNLVGAPRDSTGGEERRPAQHAQTSTAGPGAGSPPVDASGEPGVPRANGAQVVVHELDLGTLDLGDITSDPVKQQSVAFKLASEEVVRAGIALLLLVLLAGIIVGAFTKVTNWEQTKELLDVSLPTVTALLGTAIGFYFGTRIMR